eukprot:SAG22_NODE_130_length_18670_cov_12.091379_9_plen_158_part_00
MNVTATRSQLDEVFDEVDAVEGPACCRGDGKAQVAELAAFWAHIGNCGRHKSCAGCRMAGCGWCVEEKVCALDEPRKCDIGPENHVGEAGDVKECPAVAVAGEAADTSGGGGGGGAAAADPPEAEGKTQKKRKKRKKAQKPEEPEEPGKAGTGDRDL